MFLMLHGAAAMLTGLAWSAVLAAVDICDMRE